MTWGSAGGRKGLSDRGDRVRARRAAHTGLPDGGLLAPARMVALRSPPVFAAALKVTVPVVVPVAAPVSDNQPALDAADQTQPLTVVTVMLPVPPALATV